jgi:hypothetical protein
MKCDAEDASSVTSIREPSFRILVDDLIPLTTCAKGIDQAFYSNGFIFWTCVRSQLSETERIKPLLSILRPCTKIAA